MTAFSKWTAVALLGAGLAIGATASYAQHEEGGGSDSGSHGKKGPKYMGGSDRSHSSAAHKGGSSHHDSAEGGSKSTEDKIFHGKSGGSEGHEEGGTETEHTH